MWPLRFFAFLSLACLACAAVIKSQRHINYYFSNHVVRLEGSCKLEDMLWQMWNKCNQSGCTLGHDGHEAIPCKDGVNKLYIKARWDDWEARHAFIASLIEVFKNVKREKSYKKNSCTYDCRVKTCEDKWVTVWETPQKLELWQFDDSGRQRANMLDPTGVLGWFAGQMCTNLLEDDPLTAEFKANYTRQMELEDAKQKVPLPKLKFVQCFQLVTIVGKPTEQHGGNIKELASRSLSHSAGAGCVTVQDKFNYFHGQVLVISDSKKKEKYTHGPR
ncbi:hypothetical protein BC832DRAFT_540371 [Gaertneriomyces semiglobifer]|nr:hypothetical protein BC832DRAFT_540371 [Gaertneriomyces semiglobifer]